MSNTDHVKTNYFSLWQGNKLMDKEAAADMIYFDHWKASGTISRGSFTQKLGV